MATNPLGQTQRGIIREHDKVKDLELEEKRQAAKPEDVKLNVSDKPSEKEEEKVCFLPKCLLLLLAVLALLAGVIVLVYYFRDKTSADDLRGKVTKDKKRVEECHDTSVELGDIIEIRCNFTEAFTEEVKAIYKDIAGAKTSDFVCLKPNDESIVTCTAKNETSCSSHGDVEIRFIERSDDKETVKFTKTVNVNVTAANVSLVTSIRQMRVGNTSEYQFQLSCQYTGDCSSHVMEFYGDTADIEVTRECTTTYSNKDGYSITCNALMSSQVFFNHNNGSSIYCRLKQGEMEIKREQLLLPSCNDIENITNCKANTTTLYDCDDRSPLLDNCTTVCNVLQECYPSRVMVSSTNSSSCPTECVLGWCRHEATNELDTSGTSYVEKLCPNSP